MSWESDGTRVSFFPLHLRVAEVRSMIILIGFMVIVEGRRATIGGWPACEELERIEGSYMVMVAYGAVIGFDKYTEKETDVVRNVYVDVKVFI